jgi:hypothetical protein
MILYSRLINSIFYAKSQSHIMIVSQSASQSTRELQLLALWDVAPEERTNPSKSLLYKHVYYIYNFVSIH